jgi:hypothetical protein
VGRAGRIAESARGSYPHDAADSAQLFHKSRVVVDISAMAVVEVRDDSRVPRSSDVREVGATDRRGPSGQRRMACAHDHEARLTTQSRVPVKWICPTRG